MTTFNMRSGATLLLLVLSTMLPTGCVGNTPLPDYHYYRLSVAATATQGSAKAGLVLVEAPSAPAVYAPRAIAHSDGKDPVALGHYHYHAWIDPPPRMIQQELVHYLQTMQLGDAVVVDTGRPKPDYRISGEIRHFERLKTAQGWAAVVEIEFRLDAASNTGPLFVQRYKQQVAASDTTMEGTVEAFSAAVTGVFRALSADLLKVIESNGQPE